MNGERIDAALIREAVRVQRDRTLLQVRDIIDSLKVEDYNYRKYDNEPRTAKQFRQELTDRLRELDGD